MRTRTLSAILAAALATGLSAQDVKKPPADPDKPDATRPADDFRREGDAEARRKKDPLEGKAPPPMQVAQWMNIETEGLTFDELKGKVIAIKFWGVW